MRFSRFAAPGALFFIALVSSGQEMLTNDSILRLVKSHIASDVILKMIAAQPGAYKITVDDLLGLKNAGATDEILTALIDNQQNSIVSGGKRNASGLPSPRATFGGPTDAARERSYSQTGMEVPGYSRAEVILQDGTPLKLRNVKTLSSLNSSVGDVVRFELAQDLRDGTRIIAPRGSEAMATVSAVRKGGLAGRGGKLEITIDSLVLPEHTDVPLRMSQDQAQGGFGDAGHKMVIMSNTDWSKAPLLIKRGEEAVFPRGALVTAYLDGDSVVDDMTRNSPSPPSLGSTWVRQ